MTQIRSFEIDMEDKNRGIFLNAGLFPILNLYKCMGLEEVVNKIFFPRIAVNRVQKH